MNAPAAPVGWRVAGALALAAVWSWLAAIALRGDLPLTYDEAFNYSALAANGPGFVATHYPFANNHVLFTLLQSTLLPAEWIRRHPDRLRLVNLAIAAVFLGMLHRTLTRHRYAAGLALAVAFASPLFATYLVVARGYLLAATLILAALLLRRDGRPGWAALAHGLATYTVPTSATAFPATLALVAFEYRRTGLTRAIVARDVLRPAAIYAVVVGAGFAPIASQVRAAGRQFRPYPDARSFVREVLTSWSGPGELGLGPWPAVLALAAAAGVLRQAWRHRGTLGPDQRLAVLSVSTAVSALAGLLLLPPLGLGNLPFARTVACLAPVLALGLVLGFPESPRGTAAVRVGVGVSALVTVVLLLRATILHAPTTYPHFAELTPSPIERHLRGKALAGTTLVATWLHAPVLQLFAPAYDFTFRPVPTSPDAAACWRRHGAPDPAQRIAVERNGVALGLLCY